MPAHRKTLVVLTRDAQPAHATCPAERCGEPDTSSAPVRPTCPAGGPLQTPREKLPGSMREECEQGRRPPVYSAESRFERAPGRFRRKECTSRRCAVPSLQSILVVSNGYKRSGSSQYRENPICI